MVVTLEGGPDRIAVGEVHQEMIVRVSEGREGDVRRV